MAADPRVLLAARWFPPTVGGIEKYLDELYGGLAQRCPVTVVAPSGQGGSPGRAYRYVPARGTAAASAGSKWPLVHLTLASARVAASADVICAGHVLTGASAVAIGRALRRPSVIHTYGLELANGQLLRSKSAVLKLADAVISISEYTTNLLLALGVSDQKIHFIPPGVDTARYRPSATARAGEARILTVSRLDGYSRYKGHDVLAEALGKLKRDGLPFEWHIVGTGDDAGYISERVAANDLVDRVVFRGHLSDDEVVREYQEADVFAMPNRADAEGASEGFGMVFIEAQACGTPVLAGIAGGTGAAVEEGRGGRRVNGADPASVAQALRSILIDPEERDAMGRRGRLWTSEHHAWGRRIDALHDLLLRLHRS